MKVNMRPSFSGVSAGKILFEPHVPHRHTQTCATHTYAHADMKVHCTQMQVSTCTHTPSDTKPAQHSCAFVWCKHGHPGRRGRFPASLILNLILISVCFCVCLSSRLSLSVSVSLPVSLCLTPYSSLSHCLFISVSLCLSQKSNFPSFSLILSHSPVSLCLPWILEMQVECQW